MQGLAKRQKAERLSVSFAIGVVAIEERGVVINRIAVETMGMPDWYMVHGQRC